MTDLCVRFRLAKSPFACARAPRLAFILALLICLPGCRVSILAERPPKFEPHQFRLDKEESRDLKIYRGWATEAWLEAQSRLPDVAFNADYECGFRDGFVDYVFGGGSGEPPPFPPRKYWRTVLRNAIGNGAVKAWRDGYRHGSRVAFEGGYRDRAVVPPAGLGARDSVAVAEAEARGWNDQATTEAPLYSMEDQDSPPYTTSDFDDSAERLPLNAVEQIQPEPTSARGGVGGSRTTEPGELRGSRTTKPEGFGGAPPKTDPSPANNPIVDDEIPPDRQSAREPERMPAPAQNELRFAPSNNAAPPRMELSLPVEQYGADGPALGDLFLDPPAARPDPRSSSSNTPSRSSSSQQTPLRSIAQLQRETASTSIDRSRVRVRPPVTTTAAQFDKLPPVTPNAKPEAGDRHSMEELRDIAFGTPENQTPMLSIDSDNGLGTGVATASYETEVTNESDPPLPNPRLEPRRFKTPEQTRQRAYMRFKEN